MVGAYSVSHDILIHQGVAIMFVPYLILAAFGYVLSVFVSSPIVVDDVKSVSKPAPSQG